MKCRILGAVILLTFVLTSCGNATDTVVDGNDKSDAISKDMNSSDDNSISNGDITVQKEVSSETSDESEEPAKDYPMEIVNAELKDGKLLIGKDIVLQLLSMNFGEVRDAVNSSEEAGKFEWDEVERFAYVDSDGNVQSKGSFTAILRLDSFYTYVLEFYNEMDEAIPMDNCILMEVHTNIPDGIVYAKGLREDDTSMTFESIVSDYPETTEHEKPDTWRKDDSWQFSYYLTVLSDYACSISDTNHPFFIVYDFWLNDDGSCSEIKMKAIKGFEFNHYGLSDEKSIYVEDLIKAKLGDGH